MGLWDIDKIPYVGREKGPQEGLAFHYYDALQHPCFWKRSTV